MLNIRRTSMFKLHKPISACSLEQSDLFMLFDQCLYCLPIQHPSSGSQVDSLTFYDLYSNKLMFLEKNKLIFKFNWTKFTYLQSQTIPVLCKL